VSRSRTVASDVEPLAEVETAYARIERGEANPTWTTVTQVAQALGVTLSELGSAVEQTR
jgi:transcriptional regulator with XRE-family HTH domain